MGDSDPRELEVDVPETAGMDDETGRPTTDLGTCLVTGGAGFLGSNLARELCLRGHRVRVFDRAPVTYSHDHLEVIQGDVTQLDDLRKACEGIDTVFHAAAVLDFARFPTEERRARSFAINVEGVRNLVQACRESGVARLVHTSSNNVTLDGPVVNGDETTAYAANPRDLYTQTKIAGEKVALAANGEDGLLSCAIRPGGIYGPGDGLMLGRLIEECASGMFVSTIGDGSALSDNTYIDNLVDGQIQAALHLTADSPVAGEAYFITDGAPINYFEFFRPIVEGTGFRYPTTKLPGRPFELLCAGWEFMHRYLGLPAPFMTWLEVRKITVSHYSRIDKARRDFGWVPKVSVAEAAETCVVYCRELLETRETVDRPALGWWVAILGGMTALGVLTLSGDAHQWWSETITSWTPRWLLAGIFVWAVLLHVYKGMKAVRIAERAGLHQTSMGWGWQTFLLGFASLGLLEKRTGGRGNDAAPPASPSSV